MTLHVVAIHDDDWTSTPADIAAADFIDGESIVQTRDGQVPHLRGILSVEGALTSVNSVVYETAGRGHMTLMPSTWKETEKLTHELDVRTVPVQDGTTAGDFNNALLQRVELEEWNGGYDITLTENMNWINAGDSQVAAANATSTNVVALLMLQYGPAIPWDGRSWPCVVISKTAGTDVTADVWSEVANELLTDDGLDPDATYRPLWGMAYNEASINTVLLAWRMTSVDHKTQIGGLGAGSNFGSMVRTWFKNDSMLINGDTNVKIEALGDAAHKPTVVIAFQEVKRGAEPRSAGRATAPRRARGPMPTRAGFMGRFG